MSLSEWSDYIDNCVFTMSKIKWELRTISLTIDNFWIRIYTIRKQWTTIVFVCAKLMQMIFNLSNDYEIRIEKA